jgi:hypothetical protein
MTWRSRLYRAAIAVAGLPSTVPSALAQDEASIAREPVTCINVSRLQTIEIVDEQTIVFYLPGERIYRNSLHQRCPNLDRTDTIRYDITASRLARLCGSEMVDTEDGIRCRLGRFEPITRDEVKALAAARSDARAT